MRNKIVLLLSATLLIMSLVPFAAALIFVRDAFVSQERIYKNQDLNRVLQDTQNHLKTLSKLAPENEQAYKKLFEEIQDLKLIYGEDTFFSERLSATLSKYFFTGFGAALALSLLLGLYLSSLINRIYKKAHDELLEQRDRSKYLEEIARWQEIAQKLAHEIRRPLQPIGTWMSNLKSSYARNPADFQALLTEADSAIDDEIRSLRRMVDEFAKFADLPKPDKKKTDIKEFLKKFADQYSNIWESVTFSIRCESEGLFCLIDPMLSRQVLTNMVENAVEANANTLIKVELSAKTEGSHIIIDVFNTGITLSEEQRTRIFDLYFSTKQNTKNMGLGLSIVKVAILEQGGDVRCLEEEQGVRFRIKLPMASGE